jgi:RsiW-degrading membrane proteinase PrsW (M82 family)
VKRPVGQPAFWLWALMCVIGLLLVLVTLLPQMAAFPAGAAVGLGLLAPILVGGVLLFRWLHPVRSRPWSYALIAVTWGLTAAFGVAFAANTALLGIIAKTAGLAFSDRWGAAVAAPVDEETAKLAGVVLLALMAPRAIRGPLDGFGYGALVGVGFQVIEDFLYVFNTIVLTGAVHSVSAAAGSFFVRVVFGAWWSHWTFTCVSGAGFGYLMGRRDRPMSRRVWVALAGYATALAMHAWFNSPVLGLNAMVLIVRGVPLLVIAVLLYRWLRRQYLSWFHQAALVETALGVLQPGEDRFLMRRPRRRAERRMLPAGEPRIFATRLRSAQLDLLEDHLAALERQPMTENRLRHDVVFLRGLLVASLARRSQPAGGNGGLPPTPTRMRSNP